LERKCVPEEFSLRVMGANCSSNDGVPRRFLPEASASLQILGTWADPIPFAGNLMRAPFFLRKQPFYKASNNEKIVWWPSPETTNSLTRELKFVSVVAFPN